MAQVVKHLLSKCEALSSNSSTAVKKKKMNNVCMYFLADCRI
jgi:hypothetical protein